MIESEADLPADASFRNRQAVLASAACGCYHCLMVFPGHAVRRWLDDGQTAVCPHCDMDAVLPDVTDAAVLTSIRDDMFGIIGPKA